MVDAGIVKLWLPNESRWKRVIRAKQALYGAGIVGNDGGEQLVHLGRASG
jgi:hypothetical protein